MKAISMLVAFGAAAAVVVGTQGSDRAAGRVGAAAYPAAAQAMKFRNLRSGKRLDGYQKRLLRPHFGALVDRVRVNYKANTMDSAFGGQEAQARTFGRRVYLKEAYQPGSLPQVVRIARELVHSRQAEALGGRLSRFGHHYFIENARAKRVNELNEFEREADAFDRHFLLWLREHYTDRTPPRCSVCLDAEELPTQQGSRGLRLNLMGATPTK